MQERPGLYIAAMAMVLAIVFIPLYSGYRFMHDLRVSRGVFSAVKQGNTAEIGRLLQTKPELARTKADYGETPLHLAARIGNAEAAKLLIAAGADVNAPNRAGETPLRLARKRRDPGLIALLRKHGAK